MNAIQATRASRRLGLIVLAIAIPPAQASLTILTGPPTGSHVGNLVTNGSFETGALAPGAANWVYWATGTTVPGPFAVPTGWSSSGQPGTTWGRGLTTELVLDDVIVNAAPEPASAALLAPAPLAALRRRS